MERLILSVMLSSRESAYLILQYLNLKQWSREFQIIVGFIKGYYDRDPKAQSVDRLLLVELITAETANDKHIERFIGIVDEALLVDIGEGNVKQVVLNAKRTELGVELATAIANGKEHDDLVDKYQELLRFSSLDDMLETGVEVYEGGDLDELLEHDRNREGLLKLYPLALNERLDGGVGPGDHIIVYARPEMAKTALTLTMANGFAKQGARGIVFGNEDKVERVRMRGVSCNTGMTIPEIRGNPEEAKRIANDNNFHDIIFISLSPGTLGQIESFVDKYKPKWFIVDQIRNLAMKSENRTNQLEAAATGVRNIAKKYNAVGISVTQAGDSAEGKAVLEMGDVDNSNTGIPGACDVLLGVGGTPEQKAMGIRVMSLSKNKLGGIHDNFPVRFNQWISKYASLKE